MNKFTKEQRQAIDELDLNVAVSAGAGAGKTRVLVERYLNIIVQGKASCEEIIAITFTKKAAKEMRERIREDLVKRLDGLTGEQWVYWNEIKNRLEYAAISTFHSLCGRILRENPVEAGIDPNFTVLDEVESRLLTKEAADQVIMQAVTNEEPWLGLLLEEYGLDAFYHDFAACYEDLDSAGWLGADLADYLSRPYQKIIDKLPEKQTHLKELLAELVECRLQLKANSVAGKKLMALWGNLPAVFAGLTSDGQAGDFQVLWANKVALELKGIRLSGVMSEMKKALELAAIDWCESLACKSALRLVTYLALYFTAFDQQITKIKRERQVVTFADLEIQTLALLKKYPQLCRKYNQKYRYIMVDEFQDTNDRQKEFIYLLACGNANRLIGHKLFIVGDPKQSIYRFRGANVQVFEQVKRDIVASGGICIALDRNFRSQTGLIHLCNTMFEQLFQGDQSVTFSPIKGNKACLENKEYVEWLVIPKPDSTNETSSRSVEAAMIASRLRQLIDRQERHVLDEQTQELRPVRYGDMAILFRSFTDIGLYEAALQSAAIPYYVVGGRGFYSRQEILDVLSLLRVVDNCYNELAWVGVLRSPCFLLTDLTLVALKAGNCSIWAGLQELDNRSGITPEQRQICQQVLVIINELREAREYLSVPELLERALHLTAYCEFLFSQFMGKQKVANVEKLVAVAAKQAERGSTLYDFLAYINDILQENVKEGEAQIESETGDTVKLLTIHKSKGLEYPVVILPDLQRKFIAGNSKILFDKDNGLGLATSHSDCGENKVFSTMKDKQQQLERLELKRLLYVAQTRAKDYLILSSVADDKVPQDYQEKSYSELDSWHKWLTKLAGNSPLHNQVWNENDRLPEIIQAPAAAETVFCPLPSYISRNLAVVGELLPQTLPVFSASMLSCYQLCPRSYFYHYVQRIPQIPTGLGFVDPVSGLVDSDSSQRSELSLGEAEFLLQGTNLQQAASGSLLGIVVHKFAELYTSGAVEAVLEAAVMKTVPPAQYQIMRQAALPLCRSYSENPLSDSKPTSLSEWPFIFTLTDQSGRRFYFRGIVDKIIEGPQGCHIVDFKTDHVTAAELSDKVSQYSFQLQLYVLAVRTILKRPVSQASLYFLRSGCVEPVDLPHENDFVPSLLELCRFLVTHGEESDYLCNPKACRYCDFTRFCPRQL
jgi:ATP-dependent helicase/nuclease subunit A